MPAPKGNKNALGNKGGGRKTTYQKSYAKIAATMCRMGATNKDLADAFGVAETTIPLWRSAHVEFDAALKESKDHWDDQVERSLRDRANGYSCPETKVFLYEGQPVTVETTKHFPPDTTAAIFWLKNRRPAQWRDRQEVSLPVDEMAALMQIVTGKTHGKLPNESEDE